MWRDQAMQLAPNPGIAKNVINLNSGLALVLGSLQCSTEPSCQVIGYLFLSKSINRNMVRGLAGRCTLTERFGRAGNWHCDGDSGRLHQHSARIKT